MRTRIAGLLALAVLLLGGMGHVIAARKAASAATAAEAVTLVDINSASKEELAALAGIGEVYSQKIIAGRPYERKDDLVRRKIIPQATYEKIRDRIIAKQAKSR